MPSIPADISTALVVFASVVSHALRGNNAPRWLNILFAALAFVVAAAGTFYVLGGFEQAYSTREALYVFLLFTVGLGSKELLALLYYLQEMPSPMAPANTRPMTAIRRASRTDQHV